MDTIAVTLTPQEAAQLVKDQVADSGLSVNLLGEYGDDGADGLHVHLLVFDKYYMRNSSRASLSVVVENVRGTTWVGWVGSGGGDGGLLSFDWGAGEDFGAVVRAALEPHEAR